MLVCSQEEQTKGIIQSALLTDIHFGDMKSQSPALTHIVCTNVLTGFIISYYHSLLPREHSHC